MGPSKVFLVSLQVLYITGRPEIWPPTGKLSPNNYLPPPRCRYEQETVYEDTLEEICTTKDKKECKSELVTREEETVEVQCKTMDDQVCKNETVTEVIEKCQTKVEEVCESCTPVYEEKCEDSYEIEMKEECTYETVIDKKCSRSYEVSYRDECRSATESECKLFGNFLCEKVTKTKCRKVPQFPLNNCQNVPRLSGICKKVPVQRPAKKCINVLRDSCNHGNKECSEVTKEVCEKVPTDTVNESCRNVTKEVCEDIKVTVPVEEYKENCKTVPEKICNQETVKRPRVVPKRICEELKQTEKSDIPVYGSDKDNEVEDKSNNV